MPKPTSIRLTEDMKKFIDSWAIDNMTKTELINMIMQTGKEALEKGKESRTEARITEPTTENPKAIEATTEIRELIVEKLSEVQIPPCEYASLVMRKTKIGVEYLAYCDNTKKTNLPRDRLLPCIACQKCHNREISGIQNLRGVLGLETRCCNNSGTLEDLEDMKKLPCIGNKTWDFSHEGCHECGLFSKETRDLVVQQFCQVF